MSFVLNNDLPKNFLIMIIYDCRLVEDKIFVRYANAVPEKVLNMVDPSAESFNQIVDYAKTHGSQLITKFDDSNEPPTDPLR